MRDTIAPVRFLSWNICAGGGGRGNRWDAGERNVLEKLAEHDLHDAFRKLHGYKKVAFSIVMRRNQRRYDHVFASRALKPIHAEYLYVHREAKLSDHAPLLVMLERLAI